MSLFVDPVEVNRKLNHPKNLFVKHSSMGSGNHNNHSEAGRTEGSKNYSKEIKSLIGLLAKVDGTKKVSTELNIAISQVSHYKNGKTQNQHGILPDQELRKELRKQEEIKVEDLKVLVRDRITKVVESITDEKINDTDLVKASKAAANLASVYDKFGNKTVSLNDNRQFVFYGTVPKKEEEYEVVEAEVVSR